MARKLNGTNPTGNDWVYVKSIVLHPKGMKAMTFTAKSYATDYYKFPIADWSVIQGKLSSGKKTLYLYATPHPLFSPMRGGEFQQDEFPDCSGYEFYRVEGRGPSDGCDGPCFKARLVNKANAKNKVYEIDQSDLDGWYFDWTERPALMETLRNDTPVILQAFVVNEMGGRVRLHVVSAWVVK